MPHDIYPTSHKKATLQKFKCLLYRTWRSGDVFGEGIVDLSDFTLLRVKRRLDQRMIAKSIADRTVIMAPETALPAVLALCRRLKPPARPDVMVVLPRKYKHASRVAGFILNIFACDHLDGFKLILTRAPWSPVIAILQPTGRRSEITLVGVAECGKPVNTSAISWPPHIINQVCRLRKALGADLTIWSRPKSIAAWRKHFKDALIHVLPS